MIAPTEQIIDVDGQDLRVTVRPGQAGATPLLIINGIGASLELLQPFVDALDPAKSGDVIRFDVPGVGGSPLPSRPYRFSGLCRLIVKMLSALGYSQVDVLGISWGGGVAQQFAVSQRSRCRRLVLVSTATGATMVPPRFSVLRQLAGRQRYVDSGHLASVAPDLYGGSARAEPERIGHQVGARRQQRRALTRLQVSAGGIVCLVQRAVLPRLRQPTLIVSGDDDPIIPLANAKMMHRLIRGSRLHIFQGGHLGLVAPRQLSWHRGRPAFLAADPTG